MRRLMAAPSARTRSVRKRLDARVELTHGTVVEAPCVLQMILDLDELPLQLEEVSVRLELGIRLGEREQPMSAVFESSLDPRLVRQAVRLAAQVAELDDRRRGPAAVNTAIERWPPDA
jgi:hypothetical protein